MGNLAVVAVCVLAVLVGVYLLFSRIALTAKRRRSDVAPIAGRVDAAGAHGSASGAAGVEGATKHEIQLRDANNALFLVLMECCAMIVEASDGPDAVQNNAFVYAKNLRQSGRSAMPNKEIADHGYQLAAELGSPADPVAAAIRRVLSQLAFAERWGSQLG